MPKFSLVMPIYKTEKFLNKAIESLLDQDLKDWELVCVCDGYSAKARDIVRSYQDERIKLVTIPHGGACRARNDGAKQTTGKYISFFSSDFQAIPGMLREWDRTFEEHPEVDFIYGGYMFPDKNCYPSEEFDTRQLETYNYIDGGFPLKREIWEKYPWDEKIKSLNDWDFWLRIVKAGHKGYFMRNYYSYIAEYPRKGGLSDDSSSHWLERVKTVRANNGVTNKDIVVSSLGAGFFGRNVARLLDADFNTMPSQKPHEYKMIYLLGFYISQANLHANVFANSPKECKKVIHWLGTDILQLSTLPFRVMKVLVKTLNDTCTKQFCESEAKKTELEEMGVKAEVLPVLRDISKFSLKPMPEKFAVAVYMPDTNTANYHPSLMENVARNMPDVQFYFYGDKREGVKSCIKNVEIMGWCDIEKVIEKTSVLLRYTQHDGLPTAPMEFIMSGRYVVTNAEMPHTEKLEGIDDSEGKRKIIVEKIRQLRKDIKQGKLPDSEGADYYKDYLNQQKIKEKLYAIIGSQPLGD